MFQTQATVLWEVMHCYDIKINGCFAIRTATIGNHWLLVSYPNKQVRWTGRRNLTKKMSKSACNPKRTKKNERTNWFWYKTIILLLLYSRWWFNLLSPFPFRNNLADHYQNEHRTTGSNKLEHATYVFMERQSENNCIHFSYIQVLFYLFFFFLGGVLLFCFLL